jgi:two-component system, LytTR family, response regulator
VLEPSGPDGAVRTLVVDDEPIARAGLRHLLAAVPWVRCIGEAANGPAALEQIEALRPELVFLDVRMPGLSGPELLPRLQHRPQVIFTTAFAEHAVTAFELGALDYLLKPFGAERLQLALDRVRAALGEPAATPVPDFGRLAEAMAQGPITRLFVRAGRSVVPLAVARIAWFEAVGDYVAVHLADGPGIHLLHLSLSRLASRLDGQRFLRLHRTHIVNLDQVATFRSDEAGRLNAHLHDGTMLAVSRTMAQSLRGLSR